MSKDYSDKYYQNDKERLLKKLVKDIKVYLKKNMIQSNNMVMIDKKISQKMKNKSLLSIKKYYNMRKKYLIIIIKNYYFLKSNDLEKTFDGE